MAEEGNDRERVEKLLKDARSIMEDEWRLVNGTSIWRPSTEGETLQGVVVDKQRRKFRDQTYSVAVIENDSGIYETPYHRDLSQKIEAGVEVGMEILIRFKGRDNLRYLYEVYVR